MAARFIRAAFAGCLLPTRSCGSYSTVPDTRDGFARILENRIHYLKRGDGANKLLLIPGPMSSIRIDYSVFMRDLDKSRFNVVGLNYPGYAECFPPPRYWNNTQVIDTDALIALELLKYLKMTPATLIGWSTGALTALTAATLSPFGKGVIDKLIIWSLNEDPPPSSHWARCLEAVHGREYFLNSWSDYKNAMAEGTLRLPSLDSIIEGLQNTPTLYFHRGCESELHLIGALKKHCPLFTQMQWPPHPGDLEVPPHQRHPTFFKENVEKFILKTVTH